MHQDESLVALFERIIRGEGGVNAADDAAELPRGTFSRWTTQTGRVPTGRNLRKLAAKVGSRYGFDEPTVLRLAGHLSPERATPSPEQATGAALMAPPFFTMVQSGGPMVRPIDWIVKLVPVVQQHVHAGEVGPSESEYIPVALPDNGRYVVMRVSGQCMTPKVVPGDLVVLNQDMAIMPGWVAVLRVNGEMMLKRMIRRDVDEWEFKADNPEHTGLTVPANGVEVVGVVVAVQKGPP